MEGTFRFSTEHFVGNGPTSIEEAKKREDWYKWKEAINNEYESLIKNAAWTLCNPPKDRKIVSCKWVFKIKHKVNGEIDKYKARLVARGFTQTPGFDYTETYSPVPDNISCAQSLCVLCM
jgi:hypothetical protein